MKHLFFLLIAISFLHSDIIMGVVPQQSPFKLQKVWQPIADYLSEKTGEKVIFKTEKSISKFEDVLYRGGYDFAYMNPYHYIIAHQKQGYEAQVRARKDIRGVLVMKKGTDVQRLQDKNTRFLFPSPNAFAATLLTKYELIERLGVDPKTLEKALYVNSHDSVYKAVSRGIGDFGGGIERTLKNMADAQTRKSLVIVHTTQPYPSHPFAFKPALSQERTQRIVSALLEMPDSLLQSLSIKALIKVDNHEYESVRRLALKLKIMQK